MIPPRAQLTTYTPFLQRGNVLSPRSPGYILKKKEHVSDNLEKRSNKNQRATYTNQFKISLPAKDSHMYKNLYIVISTDQLLWCYTIKTTLIKPLITGQPGKPWTLEISRECLLSCMYDQSQQRSRHVNWPQTTNKVINDLACGLLFLHLIGFFLGIQ